MKKLLVTLFIFPLLINAQHSIKGTFSPAEDFKWAILYRVTPTNNIYTAQTAIENGSFEFKLDSTVTKGVFRLVYAIPQEEYNFDVLYNAQENVELTFNLEKGVEYTSSKENLLLNDYSHKMINIGQEISSTYNQENVNKKKLLALFKQQDTTQNYFEKQAKNTLAYHFIKANKPYIPNRFEDASTYVKHLQENYFTQVDFKDSVLQSSTFLMDRSMAYIFGVYDATDDKTMAYKININTVYKQVENTHPNFKISFLKELWQKLIDVEQIDLANYLATKHLIPLAKEYKNTSLVNKLVMFKSLSLGSVAPNFSWTVEEGEAEKTKWLSQLDFANTYILVFWSSTCSHCLREIPKLHEFVSKYSKEELQVIAVGLEDEAFGWDIESRKFPEFIHVLGLGKWDNEIGNSYDVSSTPTYFILDKDKKIIAKPETLEELEQFINNK